ncbi:CU044_5270 family protein [Streptosporangium roseum]|uniref:CU044_5270 family protein n=1 Tax=Streptosporangium roseum TaxID=2001 RepID=UPI0004CC99C5|nr:CU044_5270 family protein [Streptosporangium roseum]
MDELTKVRELYGRPDHDPFAKTRVEARMRAATRRRLPWQAGVAGLATAAAVAAAVFVPGLTTSAPALSPSPGISTTTLSGHSILLAAATRAEAAPQGAYWHVKRLYTMRWAKPYGKEGDTYQLESSDIAEDWVSREGRAWSGSRKLATRPLDVEAWRRDGSPAEWKVEDGGFSTAPGEGKLVPRKGEQKFQLGGEQLTLEEIKALPADSEALKNRTLEAIRADGIAEEHVDENLPRALASLLYELPTSPEVRGAAYRALAALPSVRVEGDTTDPRGRPGVAITFPIQNGQPTQGRLIIDRDTSMVLAFLVTGMPGKGDRTEVVLESGWTGSEPVAPSAE